MTIPTPTFPKDWRSKRDRFACSINPSKTELAELDPETEVSFLPMELIGEDGSLDLSETRKLNQVLQGFTYFRDRDVVVAKITPCFENGKGAPALGLRNGIGFGATELHVLRPKLELDGKFLTYLTQSPWFRSAGERMMFGAAGQKRVPEDFIKDFPMPLPETTEQRRIVSFLDAKLGRLDELMRKKERQLALLEEKRQALISHAVTRGLNPQAPTKPSGIAWLGNIPAHWKNLPIRRVLKTLEQGWSPVVEDRETDNAEWAVVKLNAVSKGEFKPQFHKALPAGVIPDTRYEIKVGDLLLSRSNTPALVGDVAYVRATRPRLMMSDIIYRLGLREGIARPEFVAFLLLSAFGRSQVEADAHGTQAALWSRFHRTTSRRGGFCLRLQKSKTGSLRLCGAQRPACKGWRHSSATNSPSSTNTVRHSSQRR